MLTNQYFNYICIYYSEPSHLLVFFIFLEVAFDSAEQVFFDLGRHQLSSLWEQFLDEVFKVDLVETLGADDLDAVLFELVLPAAFDELLSEILFQLLFFSRFFKPLFDQGLLGGDVLILPLLRKVHTFFFQKLIFIFNVKYLFKIFLF